jgi:outer membrane protein assembly factor BamB/predicted MPP superfamily phosphohydrolase
MKKCLFLLVLLICVTANSQKTPFRFAFISDTHIGSPNGGAEEDLRRTVRDINAMNGLAFVVLTGDITELGTNEELKLAKKILDSLDIPYYIMPGNHDTGWSESGGVMFTTVFGYDKFSFEYDGIRFLGCPSGPYVRMSDGHVPRNAVNWLDAELKKLKPGQPLIFLNHYPIDNGLDNWYEITDRLRNYNTLAILCGHGHANKAMNFEGIPGVMGRSNLRAKAAYGGYNIVDVKPGLLSFTERNPVIETTKTWTQVNLGQKADLQQKFDRPDYSMNELYPQVKQVWTYSSAANIISTPAVADNGAIVGNQDGVISCFNLKDGKLKWTYSTNGSIFSSPAIAKGNLVIGSGDGAIYCLNIRDGALQWKKQTGASVLGCPLIHGDTVFIGGSDHSYLALNLSNGNTIWKFDGLDGPVVSRPLLYDGKLVFGAWDKNLYAVSITSGELIWKWNNGSTIRNYSPASCIPVAHDGVIYIVAPDRYITAIDANDGKALWRNNDGGVRESIGISADGKWIYGKSMQDTIVVYAASRDKQTAAWKMNCGFGYEHVPSMLTERDGLVFFGTKNGVVYCINPLTREIVWKHKIDNSMVNTVNVIDKKTVVATTMDGKIVMLRVK